MAQLHGRVIALEVLGIGQTIYLASGPEMVQVLGQYEGEPDCLLQGSPMTMTQLRNPIPADGTAIPDDMQVHGDTELAEQFCRILRQVEMDWETHLSKYTGSLIAGEIGKAIGFAGYWRDHIVTTLKQEAQGFIQDETSGLPHQHEVDGFGSEVNQLAERLQRLQTRIEKLHSKGDAR
jgi:ubiquinone biosynthesis protein UbiJ